MAQVAATAQPIAAPPTERLIAGGAIVVVWIGAKIVGPALIISTDLSPEWKTILSAVLFFGVAKLCLLAIIFVLGKPGFAYLKAKVFGAFGKAFALIAPAREVSLVRYRIGLLMFLLPLLVGWLMPYVEELMPQWGERDRPFDWLGEAIFVASFFVLGGDFWDKLRALFAHGAKARFPDKAAKA